jgi:DNA replication and repair protein RecF
MISSGAAVEAARRDEPAPVVPVSVRRLDLTRFRSYRSARLDSDGRPIVLLGANGTGKTNLLEAVSFLAPGRGLRRARLSEVDHKPALVGDGQPEEGEAQQPWAISARLDTPEGEVAIGTGRDGASVSGDRRIVRIDGQPVKGQAALAAYIDLVWLTPQMDRLFQEGAAPRRRFLDRLVFGFHPEHASRLSAYEQALRERARLLRDGGGDPLWLAQLEETMAREGVAVAAARREVASALDNAAADGPAGPFPVPAISVSGTVESWLGEMPALAAEEQFRAGLASGRRIDGEMGGAVTGPHRSDLTIRHRARDIAAEQCSTGEQKALLIATVLAHARLRAESSGTAPILLLDEIAAHLDAVRRRALFEDILALGCQAWLTGTDQVLFADLAGHVRFYTVAEGAILPSS